MGEEKKIVIEGIEFKIGDKIMAQSPIEYEHEVVGFMTGTKTMSKIKDNSWVGDAMEILDILPQHVVLYMPKDSFISGKEGYLMLKEKFIQRNFRHMTEEEIPYFFKRKGIF